VPLAHPYIRAIFDVNVIYMVLYVHHTDDDPTCLIGIAGRPIYEVICLSDVW
jgi:hypothetical protein